MSHFRKIGKHIFSKESADKKTNNSFNSVYEYFIFARYIVLLFTFMAHGILLLSISLLNLGWRNQMRRINWTC